MRRLSLKDIEIMAFQLEKNTKMKVSVERDDDVFSLSVGCAVDSARSHVYYKTLKEVKAALDGVRLTMGTMTVVKAIELRNELFKQHKEGKQLL